MCSRVKKKKKLIPYNNVISAFRLPYKFFQKFKYYHKTHSLIKKHLGTTIVVIHKSFFVYQRRETFRSEVPR